MTVDDFKELGFELNNQSDDFWWFTKTEKKPKYSYNSLNTFVLIYSHSNTHLSVFFHPIGAVNHEEGKGIFFGKIKTKKELKILLKQLGIQ